MTIIIVFLVHCIYIYIYIYTNTHTHTHTHTLCLSAVCDNLPYMWYTSSKLVTPKRRPGCRYGRNI